MKYEQKLNLIDPIKTEEEIRDPIQAAKRLEKHLKKDDILKEYTEGEMRKIKKELRENPDLGKQVMDKIEQHLNILENDSFAHKVPGIRGKILEIMKNNAIKKAFHECREINEIKVRLEKLAEEHPETAKDIRDKAKKAFEATRTEISDPQTLIDVEDTLLVEEYRAWQSINELEEYRPSR